MPQAPIATVGLMRVRAISPETLKRTPSNCRESQLPQSHRRSSSRYTLPIHLPKLTASPRPRLRSALWTTTATVLSPSPPRDPLEIASKAVLVQMSRSNSNGFGWEISEASVDVDEGKQNVSRVMLYHDVWRVFSWPSWNVAYA
jgi:hypothetical protein